MSQTTNESVTQRRSPLRWTRYLLAGAAVVVTLWAWLPDLFLFGLTKMETPSVVVGAMGLVIAVLLMWQSPRLAKWRARLGLVTASVLVSLIVFELLVRVWLPAPLVVRGNRLELPRNQRWTFENTQITGVDREIMVTSNSLGFRGPEPPLDWNRRTTIICVGGSTTQCQYVSEGKTWPDRLAEQLAANVPDLWLNNAGFDGHSTYGHLLLTRQYLRDLKPSHVLLLIGVNDVGRDDLTSFDARLVNNGTQLYLSRWDRYYDQLVGLSDAVAWYDSIRLQREAERRGLDHQGNVGHASQGKWPTIETAPDQQQRALQQAAPELLQAYRQRLETLVDEIRDFNSQPVLITQPALYGPGIDPVTGVDLAQINIKGLDGGTRWKILERYNDVTRQVAQERDVTLIDLAHSLPKSTEYFYDEIHFNNAGCQQVAGLIAKELESRFVLESVRH